MLESPLDHSTPKIYPVRKRPGIKEQKDKKLVKSILESKLPSSEQYDSDDSLTEGTSPPPSRPLFFQIICTIIICIVGLFIYVFFQRGLFSSEHNKSQNNAIMIQIENLQEKYGLQEDDFWVSFQVLVDDIVKNNQPKCLILLYKDDTLNCIDQFLNDLSAYAVCKITNCTNTPIIFEHSSYGHKDLPYDYGNIIATNKDKLLENGVMIVKNLETVDSQSALAFQSLCDEYHPVVKKALFLLTINMEHHSEDKNIFVEKLLRKKWSELNEDLFYPLLTRISNFIFIVKKYHECNVEY